jgi:hypothetical protein
MWKCGRISEERGVATVEGWILGVVCTANTDFKFTNKWGEAGDSLSGFLLFSIESFEQVRKLCT